MNRSIADVQLIVVWCLVLMGLVFLLAGGIWAVRRWLMSSSRKDKNDQDWSLQQLRDMRQANQISEEEFETLRAKMIAAARRKDGAADSAPQPMDIDEIRRRAERNQIKGRMHGSR